MKKMKVIFFTAMAAAFLLGAGCTADNKAAKPDVGKEMMGKVGLSEENKARSPQREDFSRYSGVYRFSANLPAGFEVEHVPEIESINIYNPELDGESAREKSQIFIRYFEASRFLTLPTVDILNQKEAEVNGHAAVRYEIEKKPSVANFVRQPLWRSGRHKLTDIRYSAGSPSYFYVFAYNPEFAATDFELFLQSLVFYNDAQSFMVPISNSRSRITKKPFGLYVISENSPVAPERFSGYHTGTDYETFSSEAGAEVPVYAICGGKLAQKKSVSGYGGVLVQECERAGQELRVVYGHISLSSAAHSVGDYVAPGGQMALLGEAGEDTDNERKHLHLGIKKGAQIDLRGYVQSEDELAEWLDPEALGAF